MLDRFSFWNIVQLNGYSMFDNIKLPDGIDKELLINSIMDEVAEFEPLYPEIELLTMKINIFFQKNYAVFSKIYEACLKEYEMIENYDRKEEWTDNGTGSNTSNTKTNSKADSVNKVSAYDAKDFTNNSQDISNADQTEENTSTGTNNNVHTGRLHGNIGVTTSQQMLESELAIRPKLNIYKYISDMFYAEFVLYCM